MYLMFTSCSCSLFSRSCVGLRMSSGALSRLRICFSHWSRALLILSISLAISAALGSSGALCTAAEEEQRQQFYNEKLHKPKYYIKDSFANREKKPRVLKCLTCPLRTNHLHSGVLQGGHECRSTVLQVPQRSVQTEHTRTHTVSFKSIIGSVVLT